MDVYSCNLHGFGVYLYTTYSFDVKNTLKKYQYDFFSRIGIF